jgi:hypothetical protein
LLRRIFADPTSELVRDPLPRRDFARFDFRKIEYPAQVEKKMQVLRLASLTQDDTSIGMGRSVLGIVRSGFLLSDLREVAFAGGCTGKPVPLALAANVGDKNAVLYERVTRDGEVKRN